MSFSTNSTQILETNLVIVQQKLQTCERQNQALSLQNDQMELQVSELQTKNSILQQEVVDLKNQNKRQETLTARSQRVIEELQQTIERSEFSTSELQKQMQLQKEKAQIEQSKLIEETKRVSLQNSELEIANQRFALKAENLEQIIGAAKKEILRAKQDKENMVNEQATAIQSKNEMETKNAMLSREILLLKENVELKQNQVTQVKEHHQKQILSIQSEMALLRDRLTEKEASNMVLEDKLTTLNASRKTLDMQQQQNSDKMHQNELHINQLREQLANKLKELENANQEISNLKIKMNDMTLKMNQFVLAKTHKGFSEIVSEEELNIMHKSYEQYEIMAKQEREELSMATAANRQLRDQIKSANHAISKLQDQAREIQIKNQNLKQRCLTLESKDKSDHQMSLSLNRVLTQRQEEFVALRKHYLRVEKALQGTSYVQEIQERMLKASEDNGLPEQQVNDASLVKQIDELKMQAAQDQRLVTTQKEELLTCKNDLANLVAAVKKQKQKQQSQPAQSQIKEGSQGDVQKQDVAMADADGIQNMSEIMASLSQNYNSNLEKKLQEIINLQNELSNSQAKLQALQNAQPQMEGAKDLQNQIAQQNGQMEKLESVVNQKQEELMSLKLRLQLAEDQASYEQAKSKASEEEVKYFKSQNTNLEQKCDEARAEINELRTQKVLGRCSLFDLQSSQNDSLAQQKSIIDQLTTVNAQLQSESRQKDYEITKLTISQSNTTQIRLQLESQLNLSKAQITGIQNQLVSIKEQNKNILTERQNMDKTKLENEIQSLSDVLIKQEQDHQSDISKRDKMIEKLQNLFAEVEGKQAKASLDFEIRLKQMGQRSSEQIQQMKIQLQTNNEKCKQMEDEKKQWIEQITALEEQQERAGQAQEAQDEEIERLQMAGQGDPAVQIDNRQLQTINKSMKRISQDLQNANLEKERLKKEIEEAKRVLHQTKKELLDQIEALNEREKRLKETNELLTKGLDGLKSANLDKNAGQQKTNNEMERDLITQERLSKAEAEAEKWRGEQRLAVDELKIARSKQLITELELSQAMSDLSKAQNEVANNKVLVGQLLDLNKENQQLRIDVNDSRTNLLQQNQGQQDNSNVSQALQAAKADFLAIKEAYEELKAANKPVAAHPDPNTTKPPAIPETIQQILGKLLSALRRSKVLFISISKSLDIPKEGDMAPIELGKRQRTE